MRILSQDGKWDIPYDLTALFLDETKENKYRIYAQGTYMGVMPDDNFFGIAEYSTAEKSQKAMEMLRDKYSTLRMQEVISRDVNQAVYEKLEKNDKIKYFDATFQFPDDDEIEV